MSAVRPHLSNHAIGRELALFVLFAGWGCAEQAASDHTLPLVAGCALAIAVASPTLAYRRWPLASAVGLAVLGVLRAHLGGAGPVDVTPLQVGLVVVWAQGRYVSRMSRTLVGSSVAMVGIVVALRVGGDRSVHDPARLGAALGLLACVVAVGLMVRRQVGLAGAAAAESEVLERERVVRVNEALEAERSRIALELHDLVSHGVSVAAVQAGAAAQLLDRDPDRARRALQSVRLTASGVLDEMRRLLSVLHGDGIAAPEPVAPAEPAPSGVRAHVVDLALGGLLFAYGVAEVGLIPSSVDEVSRVMGAAALAVTVLIGRAAAVSAGALFAVVVVLRAIEGQFGSGAHSATFVALAVAWLVGTRRRDAVATIASLALVIGGIDGGLALSGARTDGSDFVVLGALPVAVWVAASALRRWRERAVVEQLRRHEAMTASELLPRQAAVSERSRVARDLHDLVAHSVSIINLQAGAAEVLVERDPDAARGAVTAVRIAAQEARRELQELLGVLGGVEQQAPYRPQPVFADVERLLAGARDLGIDVRIAEQSLPMDASGGTQIATYRILQEALTNVRKHAAPGPVNVRLVGSGDEILVEVSNAMRPSVTPVMVGGYGLIGMRERVRLYGGELDTGPDGSGHWRVRAQIPLDTRRTP